MNKTVRYILYVVILVICIISIFVGVFALESKKMGKSNGNYTNEVIANTITNSGSTDENEFESLFNNQLENTGNFNVKKLENDKDVVYDAITLQEKKEGYYDIDVHIPQINIDSELASSYNAITQDLFVNKVIDIRKIKDESQYTVCSIKFTAFVNNNILSVAIIEMIKEGEGKQKKLVQTYNYDFKTNQEVTIGDIISKRGLDTNAINKKIKKEISYLIDYANTMSESGYEMYKRDINSEIYNIENVGTFIQGLTGELYIIYPYGNVYDTAELDVVKI